MASDNTCPICRFHLVSTEAVKCPQCDADLSCFTVLNSIPDEAPVSEDGRQRAEGRRSPSVIRLLLLCAVLFLIAGLTTGLFLSAILQPEPPPPVFLQAFPVGIKISAKTPLYYSAMDPSAFDGPGFFPESASKIEMVPSDLKGASAGVPKAETFTDYETTGDETLWRISKKCYGSGFYFPVLMELNSGLGVYNLEKGARLKIFRNAGRAQKLYHRIIRVAGKSVWYGYRVVKGDSFEGIAKKFYGPEGTKQRIMAANPHATLQPGERIEVELQ
jgi:hypothetical protein